MTSRAAAGGIKMLQTLLLTSNLITHFHLCCLPLEIVIVALVGASADCRRAAVTNIDMWRASQQGKLGAN